MDPTGGSEDRIAPLLLNDWWASGAKDAAKLWGLGLSHLWLTAHHISGAARARGGPGRRVHPDRPDTHCRCELWA